MTEKKSKNYIWIIIVAALLVLLIVGFLIFKSKIAQPTQDGQAGIEGVNETESVNPEEIFGYDAEADGVERIASDVADEQAPENTEEKTEKSTADYMSPIDFRELHRQNPDIIAWLTVPGTNISYPVCQSRNDDAFYLNHNSNQQLDVNGAIFTEASYNLDDFTDPVTAVYGHNMKSGKMFGYLEETFRDGLEGHDEAVIYMPDSEKHYQLFAALRVPNGHLLDGRNMYVQDIFTNFAHSITSNKDLYSVIDHSVEVEPDDNLLVLSTCVGGDKGQRYIVVGKEIKQK